MTSHTINYDTSGKRTTTAKKEVRVSKKQFLDKEGKFAGGEKKQQELNQSVSYKHSKKPRVVAFGSGVPK